jgi:hypothetical protein
MTEFKVIRSSLFFPDVAFLVPDPGDDPHPMLPGGNTAVLANSLPTAEGKSERWIHPLKTVN